MSERVYILRLNPDQFIYIYIYIYIYIIFIGSICFKLTVIGIARYSIIHVVFFVIKYFFVIKVYICLSLEAKGTVRFSS